MHSNTHADLSGGVNTRLAGGYRNLHRMAAPHWMSDRGAKPLDRQLHDIAGSDEEPIGIRALRRWERAQKGLDPASTAILGYLIGVATHGKTKLFQKTIADKTGVGIATVRRRLPLLAHLGLITRTPRFGSKGRAADEFCLNIGSTVRLSQTERDDLIRRFNRREAMPSKPLQSTPETDAVSTTVVFTVSEHSPTGLVLSPYSGSSQNPRAIGEQSGCLTSATPPMAEPGHPAFHGEEGRPSIGEGSKAASSPALAEEDFDAATEVYDDGPVEPCDGDEFADEAPTPLSLAAPAEPTPEENDDSHDLDELPFGPEDYQPLRALPQPRPSAASVGSAENRPYYARGELTGGLYLSPPEHRRAVQAWARGERFTPAPARSLPAAPVGPQAPADTREHRTRLWIELRPRIAALAAANGIVVSPDALRSRIGRLARTCGSRQACEILTRTIDALPGGNPLDYAEGIKRGAREEEQRSHRAMYAPIDY